MSCSASFWRCRWLLPFHPAQVAGGAELDLGATVPSGSRFAALLHVWPGPCLSLDVHVLPHNQNCYFPLGAPSCGLSSSQASSSVSTPRTLMQESEPCLMDGAQFGYTEIET